MAWINYQQAFDRMLHRWIIKSLELIGINNKVISFTKKDMTVIETEDIKIRCVIFPGNSLSPL